MKKLRAIACVALICALALTCFAFTACGSTFNIDTSKQATDADFKAFNENVAKANADVDEITGMPLALADKSFKIVFDMKMSAEAEGNKTDVSYKMDGVMNMAKKPTAKLNGTVAMNTVMPGITQKNNQKTEITVADETIYFKIEADGTTAKIKMPFSADDIFGGLTAGKQEDVYAEAGATTDSGETVQEFLRGIKEALTHMGIDGEPSLYISGGVMKVQIDDNSYLGVAYDDEWHLEAFDVILKGVDFAGAIGNAAAGASVKSTLDLEFTLRVTGAQTVTAPSDADDYTTDITGLPF